MLDSLAGKNIFFNVRTKNLVAVLDRSDKEVVVATVNGDGLGRRRPVRASLFHSQYLASDGAPQSDGYVPVSSLPKDHPNAVKAPQTSTGSSMDIDNLDELGDTQLAELILAQEKIKKEITELVDRAKAVAKARRNGRLGLEIRGDIALVFTTGAKFDAKTAIKNLDAADLQRIMLAAPNSTLANEMFKNEPEKLRLCQKDGGPSLTVRRATPKDLAEFAKSRPASDSDEDVSYTV